MTPEVSQGPLPLPKPLLLATPPARPSHLLTWVYMGLPTCLECGTAQVSVRRPVNSTPTPAVKSTGHCGSSQTHCCWCCCSCCCWGLQGHNVGHMPVGREVFTGSTGQQSSPMKPSHMISQPASHSLNRTCLFLLIIFLQCHTEHPLSTTRVPAAAP
jgi:hypothetical protein